MKRIALATLALSALAVGSSANAADLGRAPYYKAPMSAPLSYYNWTGLYLGINAGGAFGRSSFDSVLASGEFDASGGMVGGTVGYNYQVGSAVWGLEGDLDWSGVRGSTACFGGTLTCETRNEWLGTVRGRLGWSFDRWMPYVTGGLAVGDIKASVPGIGSASTTRAGWTVGTGIEFALAGNFTAKVEYLYADLGDFDCGISCGASSVPVKFNENIVRAGLNYRF
ncbi:MAG TPA: outer membrane protein [Xanthobacteraceae bacterium]|jgi:outer membrane immunogenic protein|nr:outer membrane protein [Xanthobacteraceae bacterium]